MECVKKIIFWLCVAVAIVAMWSKPVGHSPIVTHSAPIVTHATAPEPKTYTEFREAHEPAEAAPAREQTPVAKVVKRKPAPAREQIKAAKMKARVNVKPVDGGHAVGVPCGRLKAGLDKWGYSIVVAGAPAYGFQKADVDNAMAACGLK